MIDKIIHVCNRLIEYSFYALFFFVPLAFFGDTSELFEFNKMWLTFAIAIIIAAAWGVKSVMERGFRLQRTPLDIPIALFLLSQVISTIFSLDIHTSVWGYYSRFNGGLLSITTYIFLYYAFVSNATYDMAKKSLLVSLASGLVVTLWGLPSHLGYDPTCYLFRQTFDVSCWTESFQPKVRIFSTLGQPNWLAAYLAILMPIAIALGLQNSNIETRNSKQYQNTNDRNTKRFGIWNLEPLNSFRISDFGFRIYLFLAVLFYIAILYTGSRSGFLGLLVGGLIFFILNKEKVTILKFVVFPLLIISLLVGTPFNDYITRFLPQIGKPISTPQQAPQGPALETGGTESGKIRLIVWRGAIDAWLHNPLIGSGVETFAFAYYKYRPVEHNLTSEWDYLYNKAHNEYLNYLTTTGIFGLGSYLFMIGTFLVLVLKHLNSNIETRNSKQYQNTNDRNTKRFGIWNLEPLNLFRISDFGFRILTIGLLASYISILVSNFLGFSVVIINLYLFLIPALVFILGGMTKTRSYPLPTIRYPLLIIIPLILATLYLLLTLYRFWEADKSYARGYNLNRAGQYQYGYFDLSDAASKRPGEPVFLDELSYNAGVLALALDDAEIASYAAQLTKETIALSDKVVTDHPNNITFWKTRIRLLNLLSQQDPKYLPLALNAAKKALTLAPTDAKIAYTLGVIYGQNNQKQKAIESLEQAIKLKPDYKEAYYALSLFYHDLATDKNSRVIDEKLQQKAIDAMQYIIDHISSNDAEAKKALETWKKQ